MEYACKDKAKFFNSASSSLNPFVTIANSRKLSIVVRWFINILSNKTLQNVLYGHDLYRSSVFVGQLTDNGHTIKFNLKYCAMYDSKNSISKSYM